MFDIEFFTNFNVKKLMACMVLLKYELVEGFIVDVRWR